MVWVLVYLVAGALTLILCEDEPTPRRTFISVAFWPIIWIMAIGMMIKKEK